MGSQLTIVAVSYQAYRLTHSTLVVGLIGVSQLVPLLTGAIWGGSLADAKDRRKILIFTQVAMAMASAGLVVNAALSHPQVWVLFVCSGSGGWFSGDGLAGPPCRVAHVGPQRGHDERHRVADDGSADRARRRTGTRGG
jgi:MFS family permease